MTNFEAQWFQAPNGNYLSIDDCFGSIKYITAYSLDDAIEKAKEYEKVDSEIPFLDRVTVREVKG